MGQTLRAGISGLALASVLWSHHVGAETSDHRAAVEFAEGQRAYAAGDFRHAGDAFEKAYHDKPHYAPLFNAARAWQRAGELARAANLYSRYLDEAPVQARDRDTATTALRDLALRLGKFEIHPARGVGSLAVDGVVLEAGQLGLYVNPGEHLITGKSGQTEARQTSTARAGEVASVALDVLAPAAPTVVLAPIGDETQPIVAPPNPANGVPKVVVYAGGALTILGVAMTVWSGTDTNKQKAKFDASPTQDNLDSGRSKEARTNVLVGVTAGVAVLTGVAAIVFVDWSAPKAARGVGIGMGSVSYRGTFE